MRVLIDSALVLDIPEAYTTWPSRLGASIIRPSFFGAGVCCFHAVSSLIESSA
jgi:hypothetical protein